MTKNDKLVPVVAVEQRILTVRNQRVVIDADLAELYGIPTKALNQAVKRNAERFPEDFRFQLTKEEKAQVVTDCDHLSKLKFSKASPYAFTEHGAIQAANVVSSPRAVEVGVLVVRAFVRLRQMVAEHTELAQQMRDMRAQLVGLSTTVGALDDTTHDHGVQLEALVQTIDVLIERPGPATRRSIGFKGGNK